MQLSPERLFYRGAGQSPSVDEAPLRPFTERPTAIQALMERHEVYFPDEALVQAVNVSLLLGMPLLLTGDPGVGKTRLAGHLAESQNAPFEKFAVTSSTVAKDLLYSFDELGRMRDVYRRRRGTTDLRRYLRFNALGRAIIRAAGPQTEIQPIATHAASTDSSTGRSSLWELIGVAADSAERSVSRVPMVRDLFDFSADTAEVQDGYASAAGIEKRGAVASLPTVVLIDEIDKAPRDLTNDLLTELDRMEFAIPELGVRIVPPFGAPRPVVVITSNRETALPDAFLRRCCYHHIEFPERDRLRMIVDAHLADIQANDGLRTDAQAIVALLRASDDIVRKPGLAEIIQWQRLLEERLPRAAVSAGRLDELEGTLGVLLKGPEDLAAGREILRKWAGSRAS